VPSPDAPAGPHADSRTRESLRASANESEVSSQVRERMAARLPVGAGLMAKAAPGFIETPVRQVARLLPRVTAMKRSNRRVGVLTFRGVLLACGITAGIPGGGTLVDAKQRCVAVSTCDQPREPGDIGRAPRASGKKGCFDTAR
jgi:hypothetical protein